MKQYGFYFDASRCTGCKACQIACADKNGLEDDFITFMADTLIRPGYVNLRVVQKHNIPEEGLRTYYIGKTSINLVGHNGEQPNDSLNFHNFTINYAGKKPGIRYGVLRRRFLYKSGEMYSQQRQNYTQQALSRLGVFKYNDFNYTPRPGRDTLDITVNAMFDLPYDSELELNVTTKSTKQTGPGAKFNLSKKNFKRMGASLNLELKGSYEWQTSSTVDGESSVMNSYELGAALSLNFPRLVLPWIRNRVDPFRFPSETNFKIYAEQVNRARYFKMLSFGGTVSYSFQPKRSIKHTVTPIHLAFNTLQHRTARFDSIANANPMLFHSLDDQFIPSLTYTVTYDNSYRKKKNRVWWENSLTSAGNVTSVIYAAFGQKFSKKEKELLGNPFAQFLKYSSEVRYTYHISEKQQLATRLMGGVIWAYGNKTIAPYSEQFYVGGANSIRAFTVRSIGPGRFHPANNSGYSYVDETGDIKLEANLEYRFRIFSNFMGGNLNGAAFLDAGNVWLMRKDEARPGAEFNLRHFFDSIALGTGVGIRYDLSFLILRLDFGFALHVLSSGVYICVPPFIHYCLLLCLIAFDKCRYQLCTVVCRLLFKGRIVHLCGMICLVGNCADDHKRTFVQISCLCDGSALHLCTVAVEIPDQMLSDRLLCDKLITAYHKSFHHVDIRINIFTAGDGIILHLRICREGKRINPRNLSRCISKRLNVHIMLQGCI